MLHTLELLTRAERSDSLASLSRRIGLNPNALSVAKQHGRLSPGVAAALAAEMGEDVARWTLLAVSESERSAGLKRKLTALAKALNS